MLDKIDISNLSFDEIENILRLLNFVADPENWERYGKADGTWWGEVEQKWIGDCDIQLEAKSLLKEMATEEDEWD
jgi:hypothetical protein